MKPFLLLQLRPEDDAATAEYEAFRIFGGLLPEQLRAVRIERDGVPRMDLGDFSGVIVGGGPSNVSDAELAKPASQRAFETQLLELLDVVVDKDLPYLGSCYGIGILGRHQGATVSRRHPEPVGAALISLTDAGRNDPLTAGLPSSFFAFVGHKEACEQAPPSAVLLASSDAAPVQMFRVGRNVYATQFHAELDAEGLAARIRVYRHAGYFPPEQAEELIAAAHAADVTTPVEILRRFVARYASD